MIRGPGFWARLVGPFKQPVDLVVDNVPNYFDVVKHPMDLSTIRAKMANGAYTTASEFEADVRLIFQNCYEYWTQDYPIWKNCQGSRTIAILSGLRDMSIWALRTGLRLRAQSDFPPVVRHPKYCSHKSD